MNLRLFAIVALAASLVASILADRSPAIAAESLTLADFEAEAAVKLASSQASATRVKQGAGMGLEITTDAAAQYPSVTITPPAGKWDLAAFDGVQVEVINPQEVAIRVLLTINNPGSDGTKNCNCESVAVPAKGKGVLTVPFGMWHGDPTRTIDQSNVVSVAVLLDKPGRGHKFVVDNIRAIKLDRAQIAPLLASDFFKSVKAPFGHGVNLGNALEAPNEGDWGVKLEERFFDLIAKAGFDSVRIPVKWSAHAAGQKPYMIDKQFMDRVDWAVEQALKRKLQVVLNVHHYDEMDSQPDAHRERLLGLWEQIAAHYKDQPQALAFEILNEPHDKLTAEKWNEILAAALQVVRKTNPTRTVVVGPVQWNSIKQLPTLKLPEDDRNLVVTFHFYDPFAFTHQGASWLGGNAPPKGRKWQGTKAEQFQVIRDFDDALRWGVEHRRPMFLGEFGALTEADPESRARWTKFIADQARERKFGTAYWEFCAGFGLYDRDKGAFVEALREAVTAK